MKPLILPLPGQDTLAADLAAALTGEVGRVVTRRFPDGETYVRLESGCGGRNVVLAATLSPPDPLVVPLMFLARGVRDQGARRVVLAAPYLSYMRQDTRFRPGEVVTSAVFADFLSTLVDGLATVDPHLHRYHALEDVYRVPARVAHAADALAAWIAGHVADPFIVGPDSESEQWVREVARKADAPYVVLTKTRRGDRDVDIQLPPLGQRHGRTPVLVDDIVSTARTMVTAVERLRAEGYAAPVCLGVHAVFAGDAWQALQRAGAARVVTTNTIRHQSNRIDVVPDLAAEVAALL